MNKKENQRIRLTKILLKNSLIELMRTSPINKITIREICRQAGINRSTFYLYYTDSYALLEEIEGELLSHARERLERLDSNTDNRHDLQELLIYIKENGDIFKTLLCRQDNLPFQLKFIDSSIKNLRLNVALECSEHISDYVYGFLTAGCLSIITKWISSDFDMDCKALSEIIIRLSAGAASSYSS